MSLLDRLFRRRKPEPPTPAPEHIERQQRAPFYCGTAFCGHATKVAATACWQLKCAALKLVKEQCVPGSKEYEAELDRLYQERVASNWPINRSSAVMRHEYVERAKEELR